MNSLFLFICCSITGVIGTEITTQIEDWYDATTGWYQTIGYIGSIRLQYGSYGLLEMYHNGRWGMVCYDYQQTYQLHPVCRYIGYNQATYVQGNSASGNVMVHNFRCPYQSYGVAQCIGRFQSTYCSRKLYMECGQTTTLAYDDSTNGTTDETTLTWYGRPSGIRLVDGNYPWEGRVELLVNGQWGTICDDSFDDHEARVICNMLGYPGNANAYTGAHFGPGNGSILLDDLSCTGYESDISNCQSSGWYNHNCGHGEDAGVWCAIYTTRRSYTRRYTTRSHYGSTVGRTGIRLVDGTYPWEGRVEIYHNSRWGTICDDSFDRQDARVICGMLGYDRYGSVTAYGIAYFGAGSGSIMLDELSCYGSESDISQCSSRGWFTNDCSHGEDASVSCRYPKSSGLSTGWTESFTTEEATTYGYDETTHRIGNHGHIPLRLTYGNSGFLEVYYNGRWGRVCYNNQRRDELNSVCQYLGYSRLNYLNSRYDGRNAILDQLSCSRWTYSYGIDSCTGRFGNRYCYSKLYLSCESHTTTAVMSTFSSETTYGYDETTHRIGNHGHIPLRLTYGNSGFLEVYHNGRWGRVCYNYQSRGELDSVCQYLGYSRVNYLQRNNDGRYAILDQLVCSPWTYSYGIDSCTGRFGDRYCSYKMYLSCDSQTSTEITPTFSSGCRSTIPADVIFVVDESGSVGTGNFDSTRYSIADTIRHLQIRNDFIRVGLMTFDDNSRTVFNLNTYPGNANSMVSRVTSMSYSGGGTNIADALNHACNTMFTSYYGDRANTQNYLVLLTDGQSDANAAQMRANACKSSGTRIISIGIGDSIDENMLQNVAYNYDYYLSTNYSDIANFLPSLVTTAVNCGGLESTDSKYVNVNCQESNWYIKVRLPPLEKKYSSFRDSDIYLGTHSCTGYRSGDYLIFNEEYTTCNTSKTTSRDAVIYSNTLVYAVHDPVHNFIVREYRFKMHMECDMSKIESGEKNINNNHGNIEEQTVAGSGHFSVQMRFFSDLNYQHEFSGFPPSYMIGDNVYVKVQTRIHDYDIKMRLTDCYTKPTKSSSDIYIYYLIKNGCPTDPSVVITSKSTHETRFYFQDFEYANHPDAMFVHCNATFCHSNDYSYACEPRCSHRKRKGDTAKDEGNGPIEYADDEAEIRFTQVPQHLKNSENNRADKNKQTGKPGYVVAAVVVGAAMFACLIAIAVYFKRKRVNGGQSKVV